MDAVSLLVREFIQEMGRVIRPLCLFCYLTAVVVAQTDPVDEKPTSPFVKSPPVPAQWEISVTREEDKANADVTSVASKTRWNESIPRSVSYIRKGDITRILQIWNDKSVSQIWTVKGVTLFQFKGGEIEARTEFDPDMWSVPNYVGTSWIGLDYFDKSATYFQRKVWLYRGETDRVEKAGSGPEAVSINEQSALEALGEKRERAKRKDQWEAIVDSETRLPLLVKYNGYSINFSHKNTVEGIELPAAFQTALTTQLRRQSLIKGMRSMKQK